MPKCIHTGGNGAFGFLVRVQKLNQLHLLLRRPIGFIELPDDQICRNDFTAEQMGMAFAYENNTYNHNLRTVVVDKNGVIRSILIGNEWTPGELVKEIIAGAEGQKIGEPEPATDP